MTPTSTAAISARCMKGGLRNSSISSAVPSGRARKPRGGVRGRGRAARAARGPSGAGRRASRSRRAARRPGRSGAPAGPARAGRAGRWCRPRPVRAGSRRGSPGWPGRHAAIGSSMISSSGSEASARAISTRWCWPPERASTESLARSARPTSAMARSTAARSALRGRPSLVRDSRPEATTSRMVAGTPCGCRGALRYVTYPGPVAEAAQRGAEELDGAAGERDLADDGAHGGRLAGTVGTEQGDDLAAVHGQVDAAQHGACAEGGRGIAHDDHGVGCGARCGALGLGHERLRCCRAVRVGGVCGVCGVAHFAPSAFCRAARLDSMTSM